MNAAWRRALPLAVLALMVWAGMQWFQASGARSLGQQMASHAKPGDIVMVSSVTCPYCKQAREWFTEHKVPFSECFIEREPACAEVYNALQAPGTPVLVVRGQRQLGFSAERVAAALAG